jgi:hypothetical protein
MTSLLRDREAVAADRTAALRKVQVRAEKLESQLAEKEAELAGLRAELEAEQGARAQSATLQSERDELRVQMAYFQKQIGSLQRTIKEKEKALEAANQPQRREVTVNSRPPQAVTTDTQPGVEPVTVPERGPVTEPEVRAVQPVQPAEMPPPRSTGSGVRASLSRAANPVPGKVDLPNEWAEQLTPEPKTAPSGPPVASTRPKR